MGPSDTRTGSWTWWYRRRGAGWRTWSISHLGDGFEGEFEALEQRRSGEFEGRFTRVVQRAAGSAQQIPGVLQLGQLRRGTGFGW